jgi:hypothetical protein
MECNSARKITEGLFRTAYVGKSNNSVKDIIHLGLPKFVGPRLQPIEPMGKSGTG